MQEYFLKTTDDQNFLRCVDEIQVLMNVSVIRREFEYAARGLLGKEGDNSGTKRPVLV